MVDRGSLIPELYAVRELIPQTLEGAIELARVNWGADAAAALRFAVATRFDDTALHALDVVQGFTRTEWERPWQPGTVKLIQAMLAARPADRVKVAAEHGLARGIPAEDLRVVGLLPRL